MAISNKLNKNKFITLSILVLIFLLNLRGNLFPTNYQQDDVAELEKGFFTKTSAMKAQLFQAHVSTQMRVVGEQYKINFINNMQGMFDETQSFEDIGANISTYVKSLTANGLSNETAKQYILESGVLDKDVEQ